MLVILPRSGISGDMLLSALIDLGADEDVIARFLKRELGVDISTERTSKLGFISRKLVVSDSKKHYSPYEMGRIINASKMNADPKKISLRILETLINAEKQAHGIKKVHFHELSHVDTLVDILGAALALENLGEKEIYVLPIAVGSIAPATLSVLTDNSMPFYGGKQGMELTTPTGSAIVSVIAKPIQEIPLLISEKVGCGAGTADRQDEPNILRVIKGSKPDREERIIVLETNIDDVTGEMLAYAVERLMEEGAMDSYLVPIIGKKGRPAYMLRAVCHGTGVDRCLKVIFEETGTLGVRKIECTRHIASRSFIKKVGLGGEVRIKEGKYRGKKISSKPEFEDLKRLAKKKRKSIREIKKGLR